MQQPEEIAPTHPIEELIDDLEVRRGQAVEAGGAAAIERQHERGKLTARERIAKLLDEGSFVETDRLVRHRSHGFGIENKRPLSDAVVTGWGTINGRKVFVFAQDFTVFGGSVGEVMGEKICKIMELEHTTGAPQTDTNDSDGDRIKEAAASLPAYGYIYTRNGRNQDVDQQIPPIRGPTAGGAAHSPAMTDFTFMVTET